MTQIPFAENQEKFDIGGQMMVALKMAPDEFERCWQSGLITPWHLNSVKAALDQMQLDMQKQQSMTGADPNSFIDVNDVQSQIDLSGLTNAH